MRLRSLRARLVAGVIALAAVCLIALGAIVYAQQRSFQLDRVDEQAVAALPLVGRTLDQAGVPRAGGALELPEERREHARGGGPGPALSLPPGVYAERRDTD